MLTLWRIVRFVAAGGSSLLVNLVLQWGLLTLLHVPFWLGFALSYELALLAHFFVANRWVFDQRAHSLRRLGQFQMTAMAAFLISMGVSNALVYGPAGAFFAQGAGPYLATIAGTGTSFLWTFTSCFFWIWRPGREVSQKGQVSQGATLPAALEPVASR